MEKHTKHRHTYPSIHQNEDTAVCTVTLTIKYAHGCLFPSLFRTIACLGQHLRFYIPTQPACPIFPSPVSQLSNVLDHLLPSPSRYITWRLSANVSTHQKHPATPCLPENLVELFSKYTSFTFNSPVFTQAPQGAYSPP